jgi:hypothetical protein
MCIKNYIMCWTLVAHTCNPSYSGGRAQEDHSSKPAQANTLRDTISEKTLEKKGWWRGLRCRPRVQASILKKKLHNHSATFREGNFNLNFPLIYYTSKKACLISPNFHILKGWV